MPSGAPTLLVIDVQRSFYDPSWGPRNNPDAERRIADALAAWRAAGAGVVHVRHANDGPEGRFVPGTEAFEFMPEAEPAEGEPVITKNVNNAFVGTDLEARLREDDVRAVAVAGLTTDHCCSTTARMASDLGFETWILGDAMATFDRRAPDGELIPAAARHQAELTSLHGEFGEVIDTESAIERLIAKEGRGDRRLDG